MPARKNLFAMNGVDARAASRTRVKSWSAMPRSSAITSAPTSEKPGSFASCCPPTEQASVTTSPAAQSG